MIAETSKEGTARTLLRVLSLGLRIYLGLVFIYAAWGKIADPRQFALSVATYDILPLVLINLMAVVLPWIELLVGVSLILGWWTRASALCIAGMMIMFIVALSMALAKGLEMSCGCFASQEASEEINALTLVRDFAWLAAATFILFVDDGRWGLDGLRRKHFADKA